MPRLEETITVDRSAEDCFRYLSDFSTIEQWDPGVYRAEKTTAGPPRVGTVFDVTVSSAGRRLEMQYELTDLVDGRRLELVGRADRFSARDVITLEAVDATTTKIDYVADLEFSGLLGADTIVWLATSRAVDGVSGRFFFDRKPRPTSLFDGTEATDDQAEIPSVEGPSNEDDDSAADDESATAKQEGEPCNWDVEDGQIVAPEESEDLVDPDEQAEVVEEVDLTGQPPNELIGNLGCCGTAGCEHVVLRSCEDGGYEPVWGPGNAYEIEVGEHPDQSEFADLVISGRYRESFACDHGFKVTHRWAGDDWEGGEPCTDSLLWEDEDRCGPPPQMQPCD